MFVNLCPYEMWSKVAKISFFFLFLHRSWHFIQFLAKMFFFLFFFLQLDSNPQQVYVGKHDVSVQIQAFHAILRQTIFIQFDPPSLWVGKNYFSVLIGTFHSISSKKLFQLDHPPCPMGWRIGRVSFSVQMWPFHWMYSKRSFCHLTFPWGVRVGKNGDFQCTDGHFIQFLYRDFAKPLEAFRASQSPLHTGAS